MAASRILGSEVPADDQPRQTRFGPDQDATGVAPSPASTAPRYVWALTRVALGWIFLWAFLDKTFGLAHAGGWIDGQSPTRGFLAAATGPFAEVFHRMAGNPVVDWLFMLGLLGIGGALLVGVGTRVAAATGVLLMVLMWAAVLPPANNPVLDDHIVYALVLVGLARARAGHTLGLGGWWTRTALVRRHPWLS